MSVCNMDSGFFREYSLIKFNTIRRRFEHVLNWMTGIFSKMETKMSIDTKMKTEAKKAFEEYNNRQKIRLNKIASLGVFFAMLAGYGLDVNIYPEYAHYFLMLRIVSAIFGLIIFGMFYTSWGGKYHWVLNLILPFIPLGFITWMIYASEGPLSPYYAGLCLVLLCFGLLIPWNFQDTLTVSAGTILIYSAACIAHGGVHLGGIFFNNFYFLFMTAFFTTFGCYFTNQLRVREFTARLELDMNKKKLEESNQKLLELDQMKTRFFANISHELRTPLTLLISPLETLQQEKGHLFDEEMRNTFKMMQDNAMRLLKLINDLLDLVKLESGRMEVNKESLKIQEFIKGITQSVQGAAKDKKIHLSCRVGEGLGTILADRDKLEKILLNLLFNSVKFTPSGGKIELSAMEGDESLILKVADTGMGIAEQNLPHVFDRFWQVDSSAQRKYQGTGIGLSLVKELAEVHGGGGFSGKPVGPGHDHERENPTGESPRGYHSAGQRSLGRETLHTPIG